MFFPPNNSYAYGNLYVGDWPNGRLFPFYTSEGINAILKNVYTEARKTFYRLGEKPENTDNVWFPNIYNTEDIAEHFKIIDDQITNLQIQATSDYVTPDSLTNVYEKNGENEYTFYVITNYHEEEDYNTGENTTLQNNTDENAKVAILKNTHIDDKFYAVDRVLLKYYYKKTDKTPDDEPYKFNVIEDYDTYNTIDGKFYQLDQALNQFYYKKSEKSEEKSTKLEFNVINDYDENTDIDTYFLKVDTYIQENIESIESYLTTSNETMKAQEDRIAENTKIINDQERLIKDNKTAILNKILALKAIADANKKEIALNLETIEPSQNTTKIFNTLAAQANEEISLNREVIEENNESLNKMNQNNESQADNNALYVMVTALTAPFIGLSLYYSSDTEENIDNEIEAF